MKPISLKTLRDATWQQVYNYVGHLTSFVTYACDEVPGLTVTHEKRRRRSKVVTTYSYKGKRVDSPIAAVRLWNNEAKTFKSGGRHVADGAEPAGRGSGGSI